MRERGLLRERVSRHANGHELLRQLHDRLHECQRHDIVRERRLHPGLLGALQELRQQRRQRLRNGGQHAHELRDVRNGVQPRECLRKLLNRDLHPRDLQLGLLELRFGLGERMRDKAQRT